MPRHIGRPLLLLLTVLASSWAVAPPAVSLQQKREIYTNLLPGTVWIQSADAGKGTGWIVDESRRWVLTCYHVVGKNDTVEVIFPWWEKNHLVADRQSYLAHTPMLRKQGLILRGKVIRRSPESDLALVELTALPKRVQSLSLADKTPSPGEEVHLVGNRYDVATLWAYGIGHIRSVHMMRKGYFSAGQQLAKGARMLSASIPFNEGDSGGPVVNHDGRVVGMAAAVEWEMQGAGLCIDLSAIRSFLDAKAKPLAKSNAPLYSKLVPSVVIVEYDGGERRGGVILDRERGLILTTARAVAQEKTVNVTCAVHQRNDYVTDASWYRLQRDSLTKRGYRVKGTVLARDRRLNLALLEVTKLPATATAIKFADDKPQPGDPLHLLSHPRQSDLLWLYATGCVRQCGHIKLGLSDDDPAPAVVFVQAPLGSEEEGGPVVNERGEIVALASGRIGPQQLLVYALAGDEIKSFVGLHRGLSTPRKIADYLARGKLFLRARAFVQANEAYVEVTKLAPDSPEGYLGRATVRNRQGQFAQALADLAVTDKIAPKNPILWCERARAMIGQKNSPHALKAAEQAVKLAPKSGYAHACRAAAHFHVDNLKFAMRDADEAVWLDSRQTLGYRVRGMVHARQGADEKAVQEFTRALACDPHDPETLVERGAVHLHRHDHDAAQADFKEALRLDPNNALALAGRGRIRLHRKQYDEALRDLDAAIGREPNLAGARYDRATEWLRRGKRTAAIEEYVHAMKTDRTLVPDILGDFARVMNEANETDEGMAKAAKRLLETTRDIADRDDLKRRIDEGLKAARGVKRLREVIVEVRKEWLDR